MTFWQKLLHLFGLACPPAVVSLAMPVYLMFMDPIMILVLGWNVAGAVIATVIGNAAGAAFYILYFVRGNSTLSIRLRELSRPEKVCGPALKRKKAHPGTDTGSAAG